MSTLDRQKAREAPAQNPYVQYDTDADIPNEAGQLTQPQPAIPGGGPANQMAMPDINEKAAKELFDLIDSGQVPQEEMQYAIGVLDNFDKKNPGVLTAHINYKKSLNRQPLTDAEAQTLDAVEPETEPKWGGVGIYTHPAAVPGMFLDTVVAVPDLAKTAAGGAVAEVMGGALGAAWLGITSASDALEISESRPLQRVDESVNIMNAVSDSINFLFQPWTDPGRRTVEAVAPMLMKIDMMARDAAESDHNDVLRHPAMAALIYTGIIGAPELLGIKAGSAFVRPSRFMRQNSKRVQALAKELDVDLNERDLVDSLVRAASEYNSTRGANMPAVHKALVDEITAQRAARDNAAAIAREQYAAIEAGDIKALGSSLDDQLRLQGYRLDDMPAVKGILEELKSIDSVSPLYGKRGTQQDADLREIVDTTTSSGRNVKVTEGVPELILPDDVREARRAELAQAEAQKAAEIKVGLDELWSTRMAIEQARLNPAQVRRAQLEGTGLNPNEALDIIGEQFDKFLMQKFTNDMIDGDASAINAWRQADDLRRHYNKAWNEDAFIQTLLDANVDPVNMRKALVGASALAPPKAAVGAVRKLKTILGEDHPALEGVKLDMMHELVQGLFPGDGGPPNFNKFIRDVDTALKNNTELMNELGIPESGIKELRALAMTARKIDTPTPFFTADFFASAAARFLFGHGIAKAGLRVKIWRNILSRVSRVDKVSQKQIIQDAAGNVYGEAVFSKGSEAAYAVLRNSAIAEWKETEKDRKARRQHYRAQAVRTQSTK